MKSWMGCAVTTLWLGLCTGAASAQSLELPDDPTQNHRGVIPNFEAPTCNTILTFDDLAAGTVVDQVFATNGTGPVLISGVNPALGLNNAAIIFDSANPTGEDPDLGTPNEDFGGPGIGSGGEMGSPFANTRALGKVLIIAEDLIDANSNGLIDDPDDADLVGAKFMFDFSAVAPVTVGQLTIVDVEAIEPNAEVNFYDVNGDLIVTHEFPQPGDNGAACVHTPGARGVFFMEIMLNGSGAVDEICFARQVDCNGNGIPDRIDIQNGTSEDCNQNLIPDECEPDCDDDGIPDECEDDDNGNGVPDDCDPDCDGDGIPDDLEPDCDGDGIPDDCEPDCDEDGVPDDCEEDCDNDGVPDDCANEPDCNGNTVPDSCDIADGTSNDLNNNGIPDECEDDCDGDGIPDDLEPDCDMDGVPDDCEPDCDDDMIPDDCEDDCDNDGVPDDCANEPDCNGNNVPDSCDIAGGTSNDLNNNGIPDECEDDCDGDGIPDDLEPDCDGDGIPDDCEPDCDTDGVPDDCEEDCDNDGVPDDCANEPDCNGNNVPDSCDIADGTSNDLNNNGIPDECEDDCDGDGIPDDLEPDCDGDGIPDDCEPDCDGDGIPDDCEEDCDNDGVPDDCANEPDCNGNTVPDSCDIADGTSNDVNGNGIPDECEDDCDGDGIPDDAEPDCDGDGIPDDCEPDCDTDGVPDDCEEDCDNDGVPDDCANEPDCNGNTVPDSCDIADGTSNDLNGNGIPDECEDDCDGDGIPDDLEPDCDGDGIPDDCEPDCDDDGVPDDCEEDCDNDGVPDDCANEPDCNGNFKPDSCDIADGTSNDVNGNGIPDECEEDCDGDGIPDDAEPDCDGDGIPDDCEPDCDMDGIPDDCEPDSDGDGTPDDCEECPPPAAPCDLGCYSMGDKHVGAEFPPDYGIRLDGLFGDDDDHWTFSFEQPGTSGMMCYDGAGTITIEGLAYGGLDIGDDWAVGTESFLSVDFVYTGVECINDKLVIREGVGNGSGSITYLATGDTFTLSPKANGDGEFAIFDGNRLAGWLMASSGSEGIQDFTFSVTPISECPPEPDCDGDGIPDADEPDCDMDGTPDDCEVGNDCNGNGVDDSCDIFDGDSNDCNGDGIPDECQPDCDGDGIPDVCQNNPPLKCCEVDGPVTVYDHPYWGGEQFGGLISIDCYNYSSFSWDEHQSKFTEFADGTATLVGVMPSQSVNGSLHVSLTFYGRVDPGDSDYPPCNAPYLSLYSDLPNHYLAAYGGPVDPNSWHFYQTATGTVTGSGVFDGFQATWEIDGNCWDIPFQVGFGATGRHLGDGAGGWFDQIVHSQPYNHYYCFRDSDQYVELFLDFENCCPGDDVGYAAPRGDLVVPEEDSVLEKDHAGTVTDPVPWSPADED